MNEKQLADRLRDIADHTTDAYWKLQILADELDPPKPGTAVWFKYPYEGNAQWSLGIVASEGGELEVYNCGWTPLKDVQWKPAFGPRQVALDVPPVRSDWPYWANQIVATYRNSDTGRTGIMADIITREEAERMEAGE